MLLYAVFEECISDSDRCMCVWFGGGAIILTFWSDKCPEHESYILIFHSVKFLRNLLGANLYYL